MALLIGSFRIICALWLLQVLIHELGHLAGGVLVGDRFNYIRVSVLQFSRGGEISWRWNSYAIWSGATSTLPTTRQGLTWKLCLSTAAGPVANFVSGGLVLAVMPHNGSYLAGVCQAFIASAFLFGLGNLLPLEDRGHRLDGKRLFILIFDKRRRERLLSMLVLVADFKEGKEIESLDQYSLGKWAELKDQSADSVIANWGAYASADDKHVAGGHLEQCLAASATVTADFRRVLFLEAAKYQATHRKRFDLAQEWLAEDNKEEVDFLRLWTEAVVLQHAVEFELRLTKVEEGLAHVHAQTEDKQRTRKQRILQDLKESLNGQLKKSPAEDARNSTLFHPLQSEQ